MNPSAELVSVKIERKAYLHEEGPKEVLRGIDFVIKEGEVFSLLGPSGCGKTTLMKMILGLDTEYSGSITINGLDVKNNTSIIDAVFQENRLFDWMTVRDNTKFGIRGIISDKDKNDMVNKTLEDVELNECSELWPNQISGGMQKRLAIARAIINNPTFLLLDEPFAGLDILTKINLQQHLKRMIKNKKMTVLLVTHDIDDAILFSNTITVLSQKPSKIINSFSIENDHSAVFSSSHLSNKRKEIVSFCLEYWGNLSDQQRQAEQPRE